MAVSVHRQNDGPLPHNLWTYGKNPIFEKYGPAVPGRPVRLNDFRTDSALAL